LGSNPEELHVAVAADKNRKAEPTKEAASKPRRSLLVPALVAVFAAAAAGGGVWYFTQGKADAAASKAAAPKTPAPAQYFALQTHAPAIRAKLLMLFSQVEPTQIADRAGKEKLQAAALAEVQKLMKAETGQNSADELLFTSFVTQ